MSAERITPEQVTRWTGLHTLAQQMEADAKRLAEVTAEVDSLLSAMAPPEMVPLPDVAGRVTQINNLVAALRADAAEWRAFVACRDHEMRNSNTKVSWNGLGWGTVLRQNGGMVSAPTPTALLAKLNALTEARKPKPEPERWRWRNEGDGYFSADTYPSAAEALSGLVARSASAYREVRNPAGDVLLLREGRPVPEGFQ